MNFLNPTPNGELCKLATKFDCDKGHHNRSKNLCYLDIYENYFELFKDEAVNILEIGVRTGNSIDIWESYFPNANIFGVDIVESCKKYERERVSITIGDATEESTIDKINLKDSKYDIIIDDGSKKNEDIIKSFELLWDRLAPSGIYIMEDLYNTYGIEPKSILGKSSGVRTNNRKDLNEFFNSIIMKVDTPELDIFSIHFWDSICIIIKG